MRIRYFVACGAAVLAAYILRKFGFKAVLMSPSSIVWLSFFVLWEIVDMTFRDKEDDDRLRDRSREIELKAEQLDEIQAALEIKYEQLSNEKIAFEQEKQNAKAILSDYETNLAKLSQYIDQLQRQNDALNNDVLTANANRQRTKNKNQKLQTRNAELNRKINILDPARILVKVLDDIDKT